MLMLNKEKLLLPESSAESLYPTECSVNNGDPVTAFYTADQTPG